VTKLSVNLNKIAWLRNAREGMLPDLVEMAEICINSGADGITVHPRSDMRHIRPNDVKILRDYTLSKGVEFNIEGNPSADLEGEYPSFLKIVEENKPEQCTLVPDHANQLTSDHGWDLSMDNNYLKKIIKNLQDKSIRVSLFIDPDLDQITRARELETDRIELYTGPFAESLNGNHENQILDQYSKAIEHARNIGLEVNAGHDLNLKNLDLLLSLGHIDEVSIGHALISDSLIYGLKTTVEMYKELCN
tara:strand:- start:2865 stop:3608 length:744 start_codon:yes stop_codon:yes gene_type:complete